MGRGWRPILVGAVVASAVFLLAQRPIFEPSQTTSTTTGGDAARGRTVFQNVCATCHGAAGEGGAGPRLAESGLTADEIAATIEQGAGIMPPALVSGQDEADVVAYVVSIAQS